MVSACYVVVNRSTETTKCFIICFISDAFVSMFSFCDLIFFFDTVGLSLKGMMATSASRDYWLNLPNELIECVLQHFGAKDLRRIALCNRFL